MSARLGCGLEVKLSCCRSVLIIAWKFKAQQQCEFSREEFIGGMVELGRIFTWIVFITFIIIIDICCKQAWCYI